MPDLRDFARFATDLAPGLLRVARSLVGDEATAERLVEDALAETFRCWSRPGRLSQLVGAYQVLVTARPRQPVSLRRREQSLQLQDLSPGSPARPADAVDEDGLLRAALRDLAPRYQLVLTLRFAAGLSLADTAAVLKLPTVLADRLHRRALGELRRAADLEVPLRDDDAARADAAAFEASVCNAIRTQVDFPELNVHRLVGRVLERTSGVTSLSYRWLPRTGAVALVTAAAVAVVALLVLLGPGDDSAHLAARPPAPPGTQLVGYRGIAVAVPATWVLHESPCGRTVSPGRVTWTATNLTCASALLSTSVTLANPPMESQSMQAPPARIGSVAGHVSMRSTVGRFNGTYRQAVFVFGARFMMIVRSPDRAVVEAITRSVRPVPDGYAVVPPCRSLPVREAVRALAAVGLTVSITHTSSIPMWHGEPPVIFQNKPSGSIVREGTQIALTIPGR